MSEIATGSATGTPAQTGSAPVEVMSGGAVEAPVGFDQLQAITSNFKQEAKAKEAEEAPEAEVTEEVEADGEEQAEEVEAKAEDKKANAKEAKDSKAKDDKASQKPQKIKVKMGDQMVELSSDSIIPVKVDGKVIEVPVSEVLGSYSSKSQRDKLFQQFNTEKKTFETQRQKISDVINKSYDMLSQKKDLRGFIEYMSEALGVDGQSLYNDAVEKIRQTVEVDSTLTPEERESKRLQEENQFYRNKADSQRAAEAKLKEQQSLEQSVNELIEQSGMTKESFVKAYDDLVSTGMQPAEITPKLVAQFYSTSRTIETVTSKLSDLGEQYATPENIEKLSALANQTSATPEEIDQIIQALYANEAEKKLAKKFNKTVKTKQKAAGNRNAATSPSFFDDL